MDVKELRKHKKALEMRIAGAVSVLVEEFKKDTAVSPNRISIDLVFIQDMSPDFDSEYVVGDTKVDIEI